MNLPLETEEWQTAPLSRAKWPFSTPKGESSNFLLKTGEMAKFTVKWVKRHISKKKPPIPPNGRNGKYPPKE